LVRKYSFTIYILLLFITRMIQKMPHTIISSSSLVLCEKWIAYGIVTQCFGVNNNKDVNSAIIKWRCSPTSFVYDILLLPLRVMLIHVNLLVSLFWMTYLIFILSSVINYMIKIMHPVYIATKTNRPDPENAVND